MDNEKYLKILDAFRNLVTEISDQERSRSSGQTESSAVKLDAVADTVISEDLPPDLVVGDSRRITVRLLSSSYLPEDETEIGTAWQDEDGNVHGTGLCALMLFEPLSNQLHRNSSIGLDESPLSVFAMRLSMSQFVKLEWDL